MKLNNSKLIMFFVVLQSIFCGAQANKINNPDNELSDFKAKGNVKRIHVYHKDYYDENDKRDSWHQQTIYNFNARGYLTEKTIMLKEPYSKEIYYYNDKDVIIEREDWNYYKKKWQKAKAKLVYNKEGLVTKILYNTANKYRKVYVYDKKNNIVEEKVLRDNDTVAGRRVTYKYDKYNNVIERIEYSARVVFNRRTFKYDKRKNIIGEKVYGYSLDNLHGKYAYKYNRKNQRIETKIYDADGNQEDIIHTSYYTYDKKRKLIEEKQYFLGKLDGIKTYKYEYDKYKNWIKMSVYKNDKLIELFKRNITYYN